MPTAEKVEEVAELSKRMTASQAMYLADFTGVDVATVTELRRNLRAASVEYQVVKNRLAKRAAAEAGLQSLEPFLVGPTALAFGVEDPIEPAKILQKFIDGGGKLAIKAAMVDGEVITAEQVKALASLPSRDELIAKVLSAVQGPLYGLVGVLNGLLRNLVGVLAAVQEKQSEGVSEGAAPVAVDGDAEAAAEGDAEAAAEGDAEAVAEGDAEAVAEGDAEAAAEGDAETAADGGEETPGAEG